MKNGIFPKCALMNIPLVFATACQQMLNADSAFYLTMCTPMDYQDIMICKMQVYSCPELVESVNVSCWINLLINTFTESAMDNPGGEKLFWSFI